MTSPQLSSNQSYTVDDYLAWNDGQRYELLHVHLDVVNG